MERRVGHAVTPTVTEAAAEAAAAATAATAALLPPLLPAAFLRASPRGAYTVIATTHGRTAFPCLAAHAARLQESHAALVASSAATAAVVDGNIANDGSTPGGGGAAVADLSPAGLAAVLASAVGTLPPPPKTRSTVPASTADGGRKGGTAEKGPPAEPSSTEALVVALLPTGAPHTLLTHAVPWRNVPTAAGISRPPPVVAVLAPAAVRRRDPLVKDSAWAALRSPAEAAARLAGATEALLIRVRPRVARGGKRDGGGADGGGGSGGGGGGGGTTMLADEDVELLEGLTTNLVALVGSTLRLPPPGSVLAGVVAMAVASAAGAPAAGLSLIYRPVTVADVAAGTVDGLWLTSVTKLLVPVGRLERGPELEGGEGVDVPQTAAAAAVGDALRRAVVDELQAGGAGM